MEITMSHRPLMHIILKRPPPLLTYQFVPFYLLNASIGFNHNVLDIVYRSCLGNYLDPWL